MPRLVQPELLDTLPPDDPEAVHSRRDLRRVNAWMGNARLLARFVGPVTSFPPAPRIVELGAGDGAGAAGLLRRLRLRPGRLDLVDRAAAADPAVIAALRAAGWQVSVPRADAASFLRDDSGPRADLIVANLFLHHFDDASLRRLLAAVAVRGDRFVACEPRRSAWSLAGARLLGLIGCNYVTRHDSVVSVRAGFRTGELAALWPGAAGWRLRDAAGFPFSQLFAAERERP
ncbi:MAG: hypothetical protein ACKVYV_08480 [Limisphaerales bacterium]